MKKIIAIVLAVILVFVGALVYYKYNSGTQAKETTDTDATVAVSGTEDETTTETVDYESIYKLHDPEEVIMTVDGREVTWAEYFYWYYSYGQQIEQMMVYAPLYYGVEISWDDIYSEETGETYAELPALEAEWYSKLDEGIMEYAEKNGIKFDEECEQKYQETIDSNVASAGLESEEEFFKQLEDIYVTREVFDNQVKASILQEKAYEAKYGVDGAKISDADALKYMEENNYMHAMHIMFSKTNTETNESYTDEEMAERKAQAEDLVKQLKAITDKQKRVEKFIELAEEYNDDGQSEYTFTEGEMTTEFEDGVKALKEYEVALVETQYGYHVIMRLPLEASATLTDGNNVKTDIADSEFTEILTNYLQGLKVEYKNNFVAPNIKDYIVEG